MNGWDRLQRQFDELKGVTLTMTIRDGKPSMFQLSSDFWPERAAEIRQLSAVATERLTGIARPDLWLQHVYENFLPGEFQLDQSFSASEVETDGTERRPVRFRFGRRPATPGRSAGTLLGGWPTTAVTSLTRKADKNADSKKIKQNIPFPDTPGLRKFYNRVVEAESNRQDISQSQLDL